MESNREFTPSPSVKIESAQYLKEGDRLRMGDRDWIFSRWDIGGRIASFYLNGIPKENELTARQEFTRAEVEAFINAGFISRMEWTRIEIKASVTVRGA